MKIAGNLMVVPPLKAYNTTTPTLTGNIGMTFLENDTTGRIYDPGGPAGNYSNNQNGYSTVSGYYAGYGLEFIIESIQLGTGDSLIIHDYTYSGYQGARLLAVGNGYTTTGTWIFHNPGIKIEFKSNGDGNNGSGFSIFFRRLYDNPGGVYPVPNLKGNVLFFDSKTGAFRTGNITPTNSMDFEVRGQNSVAMGHTVTASGNYSVAMGQSTRATGNHSVAMGSNTNASGSYSFGVGNSPNASGTNSVAIGFNANANSSYATAIGQSPTASGYSSVALGYNNIASGSYSMALGTITEASGWYSTALGYNTKASGDYSTAIGSYVSTNSKFGALVLGDRSTPTYMNAAGDNSLRARFAGGYRFYTSSDLSTSCALSSGSNAWSTSSDKRLKEKFEEIDGEEFLKKIAGLHLTTWNYKTQDAAAFRHYGPMAQDFYAAFGKDKYGTIGNDSLINQADFDGVNLVAIQALEKRTSTMQEATGELIKELKKELDDLKGLLLQQKKELEELKKTRNPCDIIVSNGKRSGHLLIYLL